MARYDNVGSITTAQYMVEQLDNMRADLSQLKHGQAMLMVSQISAHQKLDKIMGNLVAITQLVKNEDRDEDDKLVLIGSKTDRILTGDIQYCDNQNDYLLIAKKQIPRWDTLSTESQTYLTQAEYLFSILQTFQPQDFSTCILQLSRALENELFLRFFKPFIDQLHKVENIQQRLSDDIKEKQTRPFAEQIIAGSNNRFLALGQLKDILKSYLTNKIDSYLTKEYSNFLKNKTSLLNEDQLLTIERLNQEFRRKSAHPNVMDLNTAKQAKKEIPETINAILACR